MIWFADVSQVLCAAMLTVGRLSRVVARQVRNARGVRNKSKAELVAETEQLSRTAGALLDCPVNREVLGRVTLVEDTSHSAHLVESMLAAAVPVAVDMEGVEGGSVTSLVQVCDHHRNISLFRTTSATSSSKPATSTVAKAAGPTSSGTGPSSCWSAHFVRSATSRRTMTIFACSATATYATS